MPKFSNVPERGGPKSANSEKEAQVDGPDLRGIETENDNVDVDDIDVWKYQEEVESDSAEGGGTVTLDIPMDADDARRAHRSLRNCYRRVMRSLDERYDTIRDKEGSIDADEFWRLGAVNFLLVNRWHRLKNWESLGQCWPLRMSCRTTCQRWG